MRVNGARDLPFNLRVAAVLAAVALAASLTALGGWLLDLPGLRGFGFARFPVWPWTSIGFAALAAGLLASLAGRARLAIGFWCVPLLLAVSSFVQSWTGTDIGFDGLLFPQLIAQYPFPDPGRPGVNPSTVFFLLAAAGIGSTTRDWVSKETGSLVATVALGLAASAAILVLFSHPGNAQAPILSISLPGASMTIALALAFIAQNSGFGWIRPLVRDRANRHVLRTLLPAALLLPVLPSLLELTVAQQDMLSPFASELLIVVSNFLIVATLAYWAVTRVAREQAAQLETLDQLRASEERLAVATAAHRVGVFEWNVATGKLSWSPGTEQRLGISSGTMDHIDSWRAQVEPEDVENIIATIRQTIRNKAETYSFRYRFRQANGTIRALESSARAFYDGAGRLARTVGGIIDVSDRMAADERLSELNAELAHVARQIAMSGLAADLAHELNQPLSAGANFLAAARMLLEKGEDRAQVTELLQLASAQMLRAGEIMRRLRAFTARGDMEMRVEPVEQLVREAAELVLVGTSQLHLRVRYSFDPAARAVFADRVQVQQVIVNLLRNAVDALREVAPAQREILIASRRAPGNMVEIAVADTGPGIAEAALEQLFSRFTTNKNDGGGMGIGLSISKRIVEAHGGEIGVENRPEGGASFRFTLPASEGDEPQ